MNSGKIDSKTNDRDASQSGDAKAADDYIRDIVENHKQLDRVSSKELDRNPQIESAESEFHELEASLRGKITNSRLDEEALDAKCSQYNTEKLNKIYSQLVTVFFGGWWFYPWVFVVFLLFVISDESFMQLEWGQYLSKDIVFLSKKLSYALGLLFLLLLGFPTAKGVRRFLRNIIDNLGKKSSDS